MMRSALPAVVAAKTGLCTKLPPFSLLPQQLEAIQDRNDLDTSLIDDVIMGCVAPVGEQGSNVARVAAINAGYAETASGFQVNRFCASGLEAVNIAAAKVMSGEADLTIGGGVESMSRFQWARMVVPWHLTRP